MKTSSSKPFSEFPMRNGLVIRTVGTVNGVEKFVEQDGVLRRVATQTPPASLDTYIPILQLQQGVKLLGAPKRSYDGVTSAPPPHWCNRSAKALWWSVQDLIENDTCYFWTVTAKSRVPDSWFGNMFNKFNVNMHHASRDGKLIQYAGLRVFEPHPNGHGLHAHLVLRNRLPHSVVADCATRAGLGFVFVRSKACDMGTASYLCKYLMKDKTMLNVRRWACIGDFDGVKKNEIINTGTRATRIKILQGYYRATGWHRYAAYLRAIVEIEEEDRNALGEKIRFLNSAPA